MLPGSYSIPAAVLFVVGGALACFLGYRVFRLVLGIYGFVLGALIGTSVMAPTESWLTLVVAIGGGLAGAAILILAYFVGVAFVGAALAALLVHLAWARFGTGDPHPLVVVAACIAGALASMSLQRIVIVVGTATAGAWTLLVGILLVVGNKTAQAATSKGDVWLAYPLNPAPDEKWVPFAWIGLALVGMLVQFRMKGGRPKARAVARKK
jgi:hypothetical protein